MGLSAQVLISAYLINSHDDNFGAVFISLHSATALNGTSMSLTEILSKTKFI